MRGLSCSGCFAARGEGSTAARGSRLRLFGLGTLGFAGFNLLAYTGLAHARPQSASLIVALGPLVTALVLWQRTQRPPVEHDVRAPRRRTGGSRAGISGGHPTTLVARLVGWGDGLVLGGVAQLRPLQPRRGGVAEFSALRFTALTASLGWISLATATARGLASGLVDGPSGHQLWRCRRSSSTSPSPARSSPCSLERLDPRIGAQNTVLFSNLIPVTTFAIEIARGYRPNAVELGGAGLTIGALITSNLVARRRLAPVRRQSISVERDGLAEAA